MNLRKYSVDFITTFAVTLAVSIVVTFLFSLIAHGRGEVDWETAFRFAIIFGIVFAWIQQRRK